MRAYFQSSSGAFSIPLNGNVSDQENSPVITVAAKQTISLRAIGGFIVGADTSLKLILQACTLLVNFFSDAAGTALIGSFPIASAQAGIAVSNSAGYGFGQVFPRPFSIPLDINFGVKPAASIQVSMLTDLHNSDGAAAHSVNCSMIAEVEY